MLKNKDIKNISSILYHISHVKIQLLKAIDTKKTIFELFQDFKKVKELTENYQNIEKLKETLSGDCDDFSLLIANKLNLLKKNFALLYFVNDNNFCYHVACCELLGNNEIILHDVYKLEKSFKMQERDLYKLYTKAKNIKKFEFFNR